MQSTNKKRVSQRNTQTVLESPEAEQYSLHEGNPCQKLRVMAKLTLPKLKVPKKRIIKLEEKDKIVVEIYMITSKTTGKSYIGQARSHTKLDEFYVRHGAKGRFKQHVHYAKKGESRRDYAELHKDIKKYGAENFEVQVLGIVSQEDAGKHELLAIGHYMTLVPYGYNIMNYNQNFHNRKDGGKKLSEASKKPLEKRTQIRISQDVDPKDIIRPLRRYGRHYGWYILYEGYKTDFGGVHDPLEVSYKRAYEYVLTCQGLDSKDCELPEMKLNPTRDKRLDIKDHKEPRNNLMMQSLKSSPKSKYQKM